MFSSLMGNSETKGSEDEDDEVLFEQGEDSLWTARRYFDPEDDEYYTEFHHTLQSNPVQLTCANKAIQVLRQLRHPNILKFVSSLNNPDAYHLWVESVLPLSALVAHLSAVEVVAGVRDIARAIEFMHDKAHFVHCNLHLGAVFVSEKTWLWKVAGMETACSANKVNAEYISFVAPVRDPSATPPEDTPPVKFDKDSPPQARDIWALGQLISSIDMELGGAESLPSDLLEYATADMMDPVPSERPTARQVLAHPSTQNLFTKVVEFFQDITTKTDAEKMSFCRQLPPHLKSFPEEAISHRLLPVLLSPAIMGDSALDQIWEWVLVPKSDEGAEGMATAQKGLFSKECFEQDVLPRIITLFQSRKFHVRIILLQHLEHYAELCPEDVLEDIVLPETLLGLHEEDDDMVAATLKGLAALVLVLGADMVMGTQRKNVFSDSRPGITLTMGAKIRGSEPAEGSEPLSVPPLLPLREAKAVTPPTVSKEEQRRLRREEQERRRQERRAEKLAKERTPKLVSHDIDSTLLEGRHHAMEPLDSPSSGHFDDEGTEERRSSWQDDLDEEQAEESEGERSASDYDQSEEAVEKTSNDGWEEFEDWDDMTFSTDKDELAAAPLPTADPPQTLVPQNKGSSNKLTNSLVSSQSKNSPSKRKSTSSQSDSPSEAFDKWQEGTGRVSQSDAERITRQAKLQLLEPDFFADMTPQV